MKQTVGLAFVVFIFFTLTSAGQSAEFSGSSIKTGLALGGFSGKVEEGVGFMMSLGYQKSYREGRLRLNPDIIAGSFRPVGLHQRDQYYRLTSLGLNVSSDVIKGRSISLFIGTGVSLNYLRGILGAGGPDDKSYYGGRQPSDYLYKLYYAGNLALGFRFDQKERRVAYQFLPFTGYFGNKNFNLGFARFDVDIKLNSKSQGTSSSSQKK
ncbi:MAG: hypothetical protein H7Y13_00320 [Sphingobacteriaceae bacterium]|nr:hypothetical protein [Sphingobacteriaceae bacterium]